MGELEVYQGRDTHVYAKQKQRSKAFGYYKAVTHIQSTSTGVPVHHSGPIGAELAHANPTCRRQYHVSHLI